MKNPLLKLNGFYPDNEEALNQAGLIPKHWYLGNMGYIIKLIKIRITQSTTGKFWGRHDV